MSEAAGELKDATVEEKVEAATEPQIDSDASEQPTQAAEIDDETVEQVIADDSIDSDAADTVESNGEVDEQASTEASEQEAESEASEAQKADSGVVDFVIVTIFSLLLGLLLCLPTFLGSSESSVTGYDLSGGVAASVNGVEIGENDLTAYVTSFRTAQGLEDDAAWGQWMVDNGYTPEMLRADTIEYFESRELLAQAVKEQGIEVSDADVDAQLASVAEQIGGEDVLKEGLEAQGITLESYRESIASSLQQEALIDKVTADDESLSDEAVLEAMKMFFPDEVPENVSSLDELDPSMVDSIRMWLKQQAFSGWLDQRRSEADITVNDMPEGLPYAVDITGLEPTSNGYGLPEETPEPSGEASSSEGAKK